jgi:hypothetical protein
VTFALVRSVMLRVISKPFSHFSHMYSYLGIGSLLLTTSNGASAGRRSRDRHHSGLGVRTPPRRREAAWQDVMERLEWNPQR